MLRPMTPRGLRAAMIPLCAAFACACCLPQPAAAQYSIMNPVPAGELRPLSTDRPDATESPYTVDVGHWQVELDFFRVGRDKVGSVEVRSFELVPANIKFGLHPRVDAQVVVRPYVSSTIERPTLPAIDERGIGDSSLRLKINLAGSDGSGTAVALLPFLTLPTGGDERGAGEAGFGLAVPLALQLEGGTSAGFMVQAANVGDVSSWLFTAAFGRNLAGALGGFVEFTSELPVVDGASGDWRTSLNLGATLGISDDIQFDGAVNIGLDDAADDFVGYLGMSFRK